MSITCAFQCNVIGGLSNRFPGNRVSHDRPAVLPRPRSLPLPLRRQNGSKLCFKGIPRVAAVASGQGLREGEGLPLAEVLAVTINNIDNENPGDLYGTVKVTDHRLTQYIYNRERRYYESISPGQNALLTGPTTQAILATNSFTIDVYLMDKDSDASPDDNISNGQINWNVNDSKNKYEEPIFHQIDGAYGSATVVYAVLKNAVQANVEVTLIDGDGENPADVYGLIAASNTKIKRTFESVLFRRNSGEYASVRPGRDIPLSRSIVAVPLDSSLIVRADLTDYDTIGSDDEIAKGSATFPAQLSGTSEQKIYGKYGEIKVKVTWKNI